MSSLAQKRVVVPVSSVASCFSSGPGGDPHLEGLEPAEAVALDLDLDALGQRVDDRDADAVQAAGDLVAGAAELAAGVQDGEYDGDRRQLLALAGCRRGCRGRCRRPGSRRRAGSSPRRGRSSRPAPRRPSCPRPPTPGGAGRARRWSRCTCRDACGRPRGPRGPGSRWRRSCRPPPSDPRGCWPRPRRVRRGARPGRRPGPHPEGRPRGWGWRRWGFRQESWWWARRPRGQPLLLCAAGARTDGCRTVPCNTMAASRGVGDQCSVYPSRAHNHVPCPENVDIRAEKCPSEARNGVWQAVTGGPPTPHTPPRAFWAHSAKRGAVAPSAERVASSAG